MKSKKLLSLFLISILLIGCSLWGSINARKLLANCRYELKSIDVEIAKFRGAFFLNGGKTKVKLSDGVSILKDHWSDLKAGRFNLDFSKVKLNAHLQIENPNDQYVVVDSLVLDAFMQEGDAFTRITHEQSIEIPAGESAQTHFTFKIPLEMNLLELMDQEKIRFQGTVWSKLKLVDGFSTTIPLPIDFEQKVPRQQLQKQIDAQKTKMLDQVYQKIESATGVKAKDTQDLQNKAKKLLKSIF